MKRHAENIASTISVNSIEMQMFITTIDMVYCYIVGCKYGFENAKFCKLSSRFEFI